MKTYTGSLQRRGKRYYLVVHKNGHQRWFALKTDKLPVARMRAAHIAPPDPNEERVWLEQLVRAGELARKRLLRLNATAEITWETLPERVSGTVDAGASTDTRSGHLRWLSLVENLMIKKYKGIQPAALTAQQARDVCAELNVKYRSTRRIVSFLRGVWMGIGLDPEIWPHRRELPAQGSAGEHYRRLSVEEVRRVHAYLTRRNSPLADMVLIGYSTGLRLSDVAELELSEIVLPFLNIVPNKTRRRKPKPLRIPLTDEAESVVRRLKSAAEREGRSFLFASALRHRPSRRIAAAFRKIGILKSGNGRASFHSLRATFISLMDEADIPPHLTDAITGHGGGDMHARYTQPSGDALRRAVRRAILPISGGRQPTT